MRICFSMTTGKYSVWIQRRIGECEVMERVGFKTTILTDQYYFKTIRQAWEAIAERMGDKHPYTIGEGVKHGLIDPTPFVGKPKFALRKKMNPSRIDDGRHVRNW